MGIPLSTEPDDFTHHLIEQWSWMGKHGKVLGRIRCECGHKSESFEMSTWHAAKNIHFEHVRRLRFGHGKGVKKK